MIWRQVVLLLYNLQYCILSIEYEWKRRYYGITIDCTCKMFIYLYKTVQKSYILLDLSRKKAKLF